MRYTLLLLAVLSLTIRAVTQDSGRVCVRHLDPPTQYPRIARLARLQGSIVAKLKITSAGRVADVAVDTKDPVLVAHPILQSEIRHLVKTWTFECQTCAPGADFTHSITFNYRLEGTESENAATRVSLDLPDKVTVVARPSIVYTTASQAKSK